MNNKDDFKNLIREELKKSVYEAVCVINTSKKEFLTDILTMIRALPGVTIVNLVGASEDVSKQKEAAYLKIKFIPLIVSLEQYVKTLTNKIREIRGVYSFHIQAVSTYAQKQAILNKKRERKKRLKDKGLERMI